MNSIDRWLNSGRFVYCLIQESLWNEIPSLQEEYSNAPSLGEYKVLNVEKRNLSSLHVLEGFPDGCSYEYTPSSQDPLLLSHSQILTIIQED